MIYYRWSDLYCRNHKASIMDPRSPLPRHVQRYEYFNGRVHALLYFSEKHIDSHRWCVL